MAQANDQQRKVMNGMMSISLPLLLLMLGIGVRVNRVHRLSIFGTGQRTGIWNLSVSKFLLLLAVTVGISWLLLKPRERLLRFGTSAAFLTAFVVWEALSIQWALYPDAVIPQVFKILFYLAIHALVVIYTRSWRDLRRWGYLFMLMSLGFLATGIHESIVGFREMAEGVDVSYLGIIGRWVVLLLPFNVHFLFWPNSRLDQQLATLGLGANLICLMLIVRRAPFVILPIQLLLYLLLIGKRKKTFVAGFLLICILLPIVLLSMPSFVERVKYSLEPLSPQNRDLMEQRQRFILLISGVEAVSEYWLLGMGAGGFMFWIHDVYGYRAKFVQHNVTLSIWSELGIVGVILFGGFLLSAFMRMWQTLSMLVRREEFAKASLVGATMASLFGVVIYAQFQPILQESLLYVVSGVGYAAYAIVSSEDEGSQAPAQTRDATAE